MLKKVRQKAGSIRGDSLYSNSFYIFLNTAVLSLAGFVFWFVAARLYESHVVGIASTIVSSATLIATLSYLGFDFALIRFLSKKSGFLHHYLSSALTISALLSIVFSFVYILFIPVFTSDMSVLLNGVNGLIFILLAIGTTWNTLTNTAFVAFRISKYIVYASLVFVVVRMGLEITLITLDMGLVIAQTGGFVTNILMCFLFLLSKKGYVFKPKIYNAAFREMTKYSLQTYVSNVVNNVSPLILPLIIVAILNPSQAAYYYIVIMVVGMLNILPQAISQSLFAEGSNDMEGFSDQFRKARKTMFITILPLIVAVLILGYPALLVFGNSYAQGGYLLLILMSIAVLPKMFNYMYATQLRVENKLVKIIHASIINCAITIGLSILFMILTKNLAYIGIAALLGEIIALVYYTINRQSKRSNERPS